MFFSKFSSPKKDFTAAILTFVASISLPVPLSLLHGILQFNTHSFTLQTGTVRFTRVRRSMQYFSPSRLLIKLLCCTVIHYLSHFTCDMYSFRSSVRKSKIADSLFTRARCDCRDSRTEKHCSEWGEALFGQAFARLGAAHSRRRL